MNIELTAEERAAILKEATAELVKTLITNHGKSITLTVAQAAGILNTSTQTLRVLPIPSYDITGRGGIVAYRLTDIEDYMESKVIK